MPPHPHTKNGDRKAGRQCWECHHRRLVCDYTLPGCNKCAKAGKECPGYNDTKPLQWVPTGRVTHRKKRKNQPPTIYTIPGPRERPGESTTSETDSCQQLPDFVSWSKPVERAIPALDDPEDDTITQNYIDYYVFLSSWMLDNEDWMSAIEEDQREHVIRDIAEKQARVQNEVSRTFMALGRRKIEAVVRKGDHREAARLLRHNPCPLKTLARLVFVMRSHDLPFYDYLSNETSEVVQSVNYFNTRVYPQFKSPDDLAPNPAILQFPVYVLHLLPPVVHHTLVCLGLYHYIYSLPAGTERAIVASNLSKIYKHRGLAIRSLSEMVAKDTKMCGDLTITGVVMFMSMDMQSTGSSVDWRLHAPVMKRLIDMRGGFGKLLKKAPYLASTLVIYLVIANFANSSGPALEQINITGPLETFIDEIRDVYGLIFPYLLCPTELYVDIIRINRLRQNIATSMAMGGDIDFALAAHDLLSHVESFAPEDWAQAGPDHEEWLLVATVYQAAVAVYCTMAMQSLTIFPNSLEMNSMRAIHGKRLLAGLRRMLLMPRLKKFVMWPLSVAGVEAGYRDEATRWWIECQMVDMSQYIGTGSPLKALTVLQRYWQKGIPGWEECFDRPYVFIL